MGACSSCCESSDNGVNVVDNPGQAWEHPSSVNVVDGPPSGPTFR